jgi:hypothetical protein
MTNDELADAVSSTQNSARTVLDILHKGLSPENSRTIADCIHTMNDSLSALASLESEKVFPLLQNSAGRAVKLSSEKYAREISQITSKISAYAAAYADADAIYAAQHTFPPVTEFLLETLLNHLDRQKNDFFPLLQEV